MILYPANYPVKRQSFEKVKTQTLPNQNMSLKEIIRRFSRRESLPIAQTGVYHENLGDLEKLAKMDIFDIHERANQLKSYIARAKARMDDLEAAKSKPSTPPVNEGGVGPDAGGVRPPNPAGGGQGAAPATPLA